MRLHLRFSKNNEPIPFNYQKKLTGCIHKWIGENNSQHGIVSLYSFSWLQNMKVTDGGLFTQTDSGMFFSFFESDLAKEVISGILENPEMFCGMKVRDVLMQPTPNFSNSERFLASSPILIKRRQDDGSEKHFTFMDQESDELMTETMQTKLNKAGINNEGVHVYFDRNYPNPKTKIISYGAIKSKVNLCPVIIDGTPEQIAFAWEVGIGNSTGIGFGAISI